MTARRDNSDPSGLGIHQNWAFSWPANRRVMYNRASCNLEGKPWDASRRQVWWNEATEKWVGNDIPDFKADSKPKDHMGPFIMNAEGVGRLFVPLGAVADGPFPEHYEPTETPIENPLHPAQTHNPIAMRFKTPDDKYGTPKDGYDIICTTYRLTEHYHYWTKNKPMNVQLVPEPFVEMPEELAQQSEEHTSELSHGYISYAVFCLKKKKRHVKTITSTSEKRRKANTASKSRKAACLVTSSR